MFIASIASEFKNAIVNAEQIKWWTNEKNKGKNPRNLYYDWNGSIRNLSTNKNVSFGHLYRTGDIIRTEGNVIENISDSWRKAKFNQESQKINNIHSVFPDIKILHNTPNGLTKYEENKWDNRWFAKGQWWKDLKTGRLYCVRELEGKNNGKTVKINVYMDVDTGLIERITDEQKCKDVPYDVCDSIIAQYNAKQSNFIPKNTFEWEQYYMNHRIVTYNDYRYLRDILKQMENDGCCPV
jgi:hypothetical protein